MPLFPEETKPAAIGGMPRRMGLTREGGTRRLIGGFVVLILLWILFDRFAEARLLRTTWRPLQPVPNGLTVVGTLDSKDSLGRNLFQVIDANKTSRPELTDFGWNRIFNGRNGPLFTDATGFAIKNAISVDSRTGFRMLTPFLRAGVENEMGRPEIGASVNASLPILVQSRSSAKEVPLGELIAQYKEAPGRESGGSGGSSDEGGSAGERTVEHGMAIPPETLAQVCPVVLTGAHFESAELEEQDEPLMGTKYYKVRLYLSNEGRSRFYQWSHDHVNEHLVFILRDQALAAARIQMTTNAGDWEVGPLRDHDYAQRLTDFVNNRR